MFTIQTGFELSGQSYDAALLVYTRNGKGYVHENIPASVEALKRIGNKLLLRVDTSSSPEVFRLENLRQYKAIVFSNTNNEAFFTQDQRVAFQQYIHEGGGFAGIHSATGSERSWDWYIALIGASFHRHPPMQIYTLRNYSPEHLAMRGIPAEWKKEDECYYFKKINPGIQVLMVADLRTVNDPEGKPGEYGNDYPAVWCQETEGGRQWYTALGHKPSDYSDPLFLLHLENGIRWVLRMD